VQQNAQHMLTEQKKNLPESSVELLGLISNPLLMELHCEIYSQLLLHHPFLDAYIHVNPGGIQKVCHLAVEPLPLSAGDVLFVELEEPAIRRMFFISSGEILYYKDSSRQESIGGEGHWMCESVLWTSWCHYGTARAKTQSQLLTLDMEKFRGIVSTFPTHHAVNYATKFVDQLNDTDHEALTDLNTNDDTLWDIVGYVFYNEEGNTSTLSAEVGTGAQRGLGRQLSMSSQRSSLSTAKKKESMRSEGSLVHRLNSLVPSFANDSLGGRSWSLSGRRRRHHSAMGTRTNSREGQPLAWLFGADRKWNSSLGADSPKSSNSLSLS
jgi:hypothetical protein